MRSRLRVPIRSVAASLCLGAFLFAACAPAEPMMQGPSEAEMMAAAADLDRQFFEAYNSGNVDALAALYSDSADATSYPPDAMAYRGKAAIRDAMTQMMGGMPGGKLELTESRHIVAGDHVVSYGMWRMTMPGPDGMPTTVDGRFTDIKTMENGKWVYLHDHASVPMPPPPMDSMPMDSMSGSGSGSRP